MIQARWHEVWRGSGTLYNTYWVRFERGRTTFAAAIANSRALFEAARRAGVARIVHVSIANPSIDSPPPYYRGKAYSPWSKRVGRGRCPLLDRETNVLLRGAGHPDEQHRVGRTAYAVFVVPGDGQYLAQPIHVDDFAQICLRSRVS